ncbi:hypothetical protein K0M31_010533, partial [Melipona bicolor]
GHFRSTPAQKLSTRRVSSIVSIDVIAPRLKTEGQRSRGCIIVGSQSWTKACGQQFDLAKPIDRVVLANSGVDSIYDGTDDFYLRKRKRREEKRKKIIVSTPIAIGSSQMFAFSRDHAEEAVLTGYTITHVGDTIKNCNQGGSVCSAIRSLHRD